MIEHEGLTFTAVAALRARFKDLVFLDEATDRYRYYAHEIIHSILFEPILASPAGFPNLQANTAE